MARPGRRYEDLSPARVRRRKALLLARSAVVGVLLFVAYYLLPLDKPEDYGLLLLVGGLIMIGVVIAWQVRAILNAPFPRLRGFQTLISGIPLILVVFAAVFYLDRAGPGRQFQRTHGQDRRHVFHRQPCSPPSGSATSEWSHPNLTEAAR